MVPNSRTDRERKSMGPISRLRAAVHDQGRERGSELGVRQGEVLDDPAYRVDLSSVENRPPS